MIRKMQIVPPLPNQVQDPSRLVSFSDNVISVAITLLVFDVRIPADITHLALWQAIRILTPRLLGFLLSFSVIGVFWVARNNMFRASTQVNRSLLWFNNIFLMMVCLIPASAALLGGFPGQRAAVILYGTNLIAVSVSMRVLWLYICRLQANTETPVTPGLEKAGSRRMVVAIVLASSAILLSWVNPWLSYAIFWITPISFAWSQFR